MGAMTIEHEGTIYSAKIGEIVETRFGTHDRGFISAKLRVDFEDGFSVTVDPYKLDNAGEGTAFGLDYLLRIIDTVRVDSWEELAGEQIAVLFSDDPRLGEIAVGIASTNGRRVLVFTEYGPAWKARYEQPAADGTSTAA